MYRIKYDIGTAVSVGLVVGTGTDGKDQIEEKVYLPGAILPENIQPHMLEALKDPDSHASSLIESFGGAEPEPVKASEGDKSPSTEPAPSEPDANPFTNPPAPAEPTAAEKKAAAAAAKKASS